MSIEVASELIDTAHELFDGVCENNLTRIVGIGHYNNNYYSFNGRLLFGKSDDDNTTYWYWIRGSNSIPIGVSYFSDGDRIMVGESFT